VSAFKIEVIRVGKKAAHPNADNLEITSVYGKGGYPCIFRSGDFKEGDLAVYVPVDALMPADDPRWSFLAPNWHIKAKKLRGIFSQGLLLPISVLGSTADRHYKEGDNVQAELGILKYEEEKHLYMSGDAMPTPDWFHEYTSIEAWRRGANKHVLQPGEDVVIREKIHGSNGRWCFKDGQLWVGSHHQTLKEGRTIWWAAAKENKLVEKLADQSDTIFFGEVYGKGVQDLEYDGKEALKLRVFDAYDLRYNRFMDDKLFSEVCIDLGLNEAPVLYRGPWKEELTQLADGDSTLSPGQIREGFVVKPVVERWDERCGRVIFKVIGEAYLLRKGKKVAVKAPDEVVKFE
jgi:RNA ligase (TIGR02306 family)